MTDKEIHTLSMLAQAHDAADTVRNALKEIPLEAEYLDQLIHELAMLRDNPHLLSPEPYIRPHGEALIHSPETRDAIGYINIRNNHIPKLKEGGIEGEFWRTIDSFTGVTLHMKTNVEFLVAYKLKGRWSLIACASMNEAIHTLSNHKLRILIHYTK